ncbi:uncharacterized protein LOC115049382 [Echeneis naucrates]|uniref:uncharacterized protein LOC115049382 n=1 Tax=Echeneis naucrates TaxID=173247 RepID=UPI001113CB7F|nr:uncharacterized protein LOC115049382 [Echeneis naucrates]
MLFCAADSLHMFSACEVKKDMKNLVRYVLMLLHVLCASVTTGQGDESSVRHFFCRGCADLVISVYCNEEPISGISNLTYCTGSPPPMSACQRAGQVFVAINGSETCEFEGADGYIKTERCSGNNSICAFPTEPPPTEEGPTEIIKNDVVSWLVPLIMVLLVLLLVALLLSSWHFRKKDQQNGEPAEQAKYDPEEAQKLSDSDRISIDGPGVDKDDSPHPDAPAISLPHYYL